MERRRLFLATLVAVAVINFLIDSGHSKPMNGDSGAELEEGNLLAQYDTCKESLG